jgi:hypothetical protein
VELFVMQDKKMPEFIAGPKGPAFFSSRLYIRLARKDIAVFKFLLESLDNLAYLSIIDKHAAVLQIRYARDSRAELFDFLRQAAGEVEFRMEHDRI